MEPSKNPVLYISYSNLDWSLVSQLVEGLKEQRIEPIYDATLTEDGNNWRESLENGLASADAVLVLLTPNSIGSEYVMAELGAARVYAKNRENPKLLLPVTYGLSEIPKSVNDINVIVWKASSEQEVIRRIATAIHNFIKKRKAPVKPVEVVDELSEKPPVIEAKSRTSGNPAGSEAELKIPLPPDPITGTVAGATNYWLLKMNPDVWLIESLQMDQTTFFGTHHFQTKRPEYNLFEKITIGDKVIGYAAGQYRSVVCTMEVTDPIGPDSAQGEVFRMKVTQILDIRIPLKGFQDKISDIVPRLELNNRPPELFFELTEKTYHEILASRSAEYPPYENTFQPFYLTEGNHSKTDDQLDFENDIDSFASVIALKKVNPPLAIGLFGNWGSGKSFFMEKLSEKIEERADSEDPDYVRNVVPVRFNSWHYSDANLWASLITHIFESLNDYAIKKKYGGDAVKQIYQNLEITGQHISETETKIAAHETQIKDLQQQQIKLQTDIDEKKEKLSMFNTRQLAGIILKDPLIHNDLQEIFVRLNMESIDKELDGLDSVKEGLTEDFGAVKKLAVLVHENLKGKRKWVIFSGALFIVVMAVVYSPLFPLLSEYLSPTIKNISAVISSITAALILYRNKFSPGVEQVKELYRRITSVTDTVNQKVSMMVLNEDSLKRNLDTEIKNLQSMKESVEVELKQRETEKKLLEVQLSDIGSGKMLASFLASKSTDDGYMKQLGIISWIRKDFSKLNDLFKQQETVNDNNTKQKIEVAAIQLKIDRIVLYIDDLDRCNEDIVVKVLEAIHLLLAFELFVVVVGVDPRWLNNALSEKYKTLFGKNDKTNGSVIHSLDEHEAFLAGTATSYDYLEKIFQIPFTLKPINKTGREKLIGYLVKDELETEKVQTVVVPVTKPGMPLPSTPIIPTEPDTAVIGKDRQDEEALKLEQDKKTKEEKKVKQRLVFNKEELVNMQKLSGLFGTSPRSINRYVNIYRIIKAHKGMRVAGDFSKDEFIPIMFTLGIVIGYSVYAQQFIDLVAAADGKQALKDFISKLKMDEKFLSAIRKHMDNQTGEIQMENFKRNLDLISRFSFRTILNES